MLVAAMLASAPLAAARAQRALVDVHVHPVGVGPGRQRDFDGAVDAALALMDRYGIAISVLMGPPQPQARFDYRDFLPAMKRHPGRFAFLGGGGTLNPIIHGHPDPAAVTDIVRREFSEQAEAILAAGAAGFGEMGTLHLSHRDDHPFTWVPADHPLFLLLADIAARHDVVIDLHLDCVVGDIALPAALRNRNNPDRLSDTVGGLERLLAHNRRARIIWAHGGSDPIGFMTPALIRRLMTAHANLYMSLRVVPPPAPSKNKLLVGPPPTLDPSWLALLRAFPDRFVLGSDTFAVSPDVTRGPGVAFAKANGIKLRMTRLMLSLLPPELRSRFAAANARRLYRLPVH